MRRAINADDYRFFFLWRFLRSRFFRLCVAILWRLRLRPQGIMWLESSKRRPHVRSGRPSRYGFPVFGTSRPPPESSTFTPKARRRSTHGRSRRPIRQLFTPALLKRPCTALYSGLHTNSTIGVANGREVLRTSSGTPFGSTPHRLWVTSFPDIKSTTCSTALSLLGTVGRTRLGERVRPSFFMP